MINDGINNVPDKTIAIFPYPLYNAFNEKLGPVSNDQILDILKPSEKKRDWFTPHFYRCLPLAIGNQYGFTISPQFNFGFEWNGNDELDAITFYADENANSIENPVYPNITSHFGKGILTITTPFFLRTPPGVNLMTINPPNTVIPNITVMTGVVETDNLRRHFTFNLKIQIPNVRVDIPAGTPIAGFIPIPRYFANQFKLEFAENIFNEEIIEEEIQANKDAIDYRVNVEPFLKNKVGKHYMLGKDIYGNKFDDHQKP